VTAAVHGPSWSAADRLTLYADGSPVHSRVLEVSRRPGVKWRGEIEVKWPDGARRLVAVVTGPGVLRPFWEVRKPYQPMSRDWTPRVIGVSQALRVERD
jgi:hypothetical protein